MILDTLPGKLSPALAIHGGDEPRLVYESTSAHDGSTGSSWLIVQPSQVVILSAQPLGDPEIIKKFPLTTIDAITCSKSILGDIKLEFSTHGEHKHVVFVIPSLLLHEWEALSENIHQLFSRIYNPEITDVSLGCNTNISSDSLISPVETQDILFKPISGVNIDVSHMQSFLDTTMDGLADQINVQVTDESSFKNSYVRSDGMPASTLSHVEITQPHPGAESKKKKFRKTPQTNLLPGTPAPAPSASDEQPELLRCPKCQKSNKPDYLYCLGCGHELESQQKGVQRKVGKSKEYGYSSSSAQSEEASGCIVQLFYFIIGAGALLFFISLGK